MTVLSTPNSSPAATPATIPDKQAFKSAVREQWDRSTTGWNHHTAAIRAWLRQPTDAMLDLALHNAPQAGLRNVQTLVADGEQLAVEPRQL